MIYEKVNYKILFYVVIVALIAYSLFCRSSKQSEPYNSTDSSMARVEVYSEQTGSRIESLGTGIDTIENSIGRVEAELDRSEGASREISDGIIRCEERLAKCKELNRYALQLIADIEAANTGGEGATEEEGTPH